MWFVMICLVRKKTALMHLGYLNKLLPDIMENCISSIFKLEIKHSFCTRTHLSYYREASKAMIKIVWFPYYILLVFSTEYRINLPVMWHPQWFFPRALCVLPNKWNESNHIRVIKQRPVGFLVAQLATARDDMSFKSGQQLQHSHEPWEAYGQCKRESRAKCCRSASTLQQT